MSDENTESMAASKLLNLFQKLRGQWGEIPDEFGCSKEDLKVFYPHYKAPLPNELVDFLCRILPKGYLDIGVFKTGTPKRLLKEQLGAVPFEGNIKYNLFGLGWWSGETDGDGWLYDLDSGQVHAIQIYHNYEDSKEIVLSKAYHSFGSLNEWVDFLVAEDSRLQDETKLYLDEMNLDD